MTDMVKVKGITYDTTYLIGKFQGYWGKICVWNETHELAICGQILPDMMKNVKNNIGEEYDEFTLWLCRDQETNIHPSLIPNEGFINALWLH